MIRVPPQHQTDPAKAPGVWRNPDTSFDRYPYMKHSTAEPINNVKECCGNPLRGCDNCPPTKKLTFDEFLLSLAKREDGTYPYGFDPSRPRDFMVMGTTPQVLEIVWKAAQENM